MLFRSAVISATFGVELAEADGVNLKNVKVHVEKGPALNLKNVKNLVAEDFEFTGETTEGALVTGGNNKNIEIKSSSISKENTVLPAKIKKNVVKLK